MALPSQYARIDVRYGTVEAPHQENVLWFQPDDTINVLDGAATAQALGDQMDALIGAHLINCLCSDAVYNECKVTLNLGGVIFDHHSSTESSVGAISGVTSPENVAALIKKQTDHGGKTGRGRWYMGCVPEGFTTIGVLTGTAVTNYLQIRDDFISILTVGLINFGPRLLSKKDNIMYPIRSGSVDAYTKSMRGRMVRPF